MARIFVSYSRVDKDLFAEPFVERLRRMFRDHDIWWDEELVGGDIWWQEILNQIALCDIFIYLLSNESVTSPYCQAEFKEAQRLQKKVITVQVRDRTELSPELSAIQYVDMKRGVNDAAAVAKLVAAVNQALKRLPSQEVKPLREPATPVPDIPDETPLTVMPAEDGQSTLASQPVDRETREAPTHALSRRLEAAMPQQCRAGADTELLVKVSLPDSEGLRGELPKVVESGDVIHKENVRGSTAALNFPIDSRTGQLLPGTVCIEVQARDFIVTAATPQTSACAADQVALEVPPDADSRTVIFELAPRPGAQPLGRSRVFIRLYQDGKLITETSVSTEIVSEVEHLPLKVYWVLVTQPLALAAAMATSPGLDIRQQADHSGNVAQIGQAGNVTINLGGPPPPTLSRAAPAAPQSRYPLIGLLATLAVVVLGIVAILPGILSGPPATPTSIAIAPTTAAPTTVVPATTVPALVITDTPAVTDTPTPTATRTLQPTIDTPGPSLQPSSTWTPTHPSTSQAATPPTSVPGGITVTLFRDANSLTLYLPNQGNVSLAGLAFRVNKAEGPIDYPLQGFEFGLPLETLPTPMCLRLERSRSTDPLPIACTILSPQGRVIRRPLAEADIFWHNGRIAFPVLIYAGDMLVGIFGTDSAEYSFVYPTPTSEISISVEVGDWDSVRQDCYATVHVNVGGAPVTGNIHVWNGYYGPDGDMFPHQTFPPGESAHTVTLGGREEQYKVHEIWITSDIGTSNRVGGLVCNNWGQ